MFDVDIVVETKSEQVTQINTQTHTLNIEKKLMRVSLPTTQKSISFCFRSIRYQYITKRFIFHFIHHDTNKRSFTWCYHTIYDGTDS